MAPRHDGERQGALRWHRGFLSDRFHVLDLKKISVPTLVMHGDDDQIVPYADSGLLTAKLVKGGTSEDL